MENRNRFKKGKKDILKMDLDIIIEVDSIEELHPQEGLSKANLPFIKKIVNAIGYYSYKVDNRKVLVILKGIN